MLSEIRPAIVSTILFTLLLGLGYPLAVTGIAQVAFPYQANGSLVRDAKGQVIGSALLAQPFTKDEYLHPRPSAAGSNGYDPTASGGSNYGPLSTPSPSASRATQTLSASRRAIRRSLTTPSPPPAPASTRTSRRPTRCCRSTGSPRPGARAADAVSKLIGDHVEQPFLGFIGQAHVNVLMTNRALDAAFPKAQPKGA